MFKINMDAYKYASNTEIDQLDESSIQIQLVRVALNNDFSISFVRMHLD